MYRLKGNPEEKKFLKDVMAQSGQNLLECLQCGKCSGSCPIHTDTVGGPRKLIAMILSGMKDPVLHDSTWWYCVSCGTCATRCPVEINMYEVATTLCEMAEQEGIKPAEPKIHLFEELFLKSVEKFGRVQELQTVMQYNVNTFQPFKDAFQGMKLLLKGAISPRQMIKGGELNPTVAQIFKRVEQQKHGDI
jgi:heterodisulfide reductase subunit C